MLGEWLSRFGGRCLFDFGASNLVGSVFSNQWYCSFTLSSIFKKVVMLGVWLFRFGGRCLFDFGASNLIGSVFSNSDVVGAASFTCSTLAENFGKVICEVFDRMPIISAKLSVRVTGADKAGKVGASSISEIGPRGL
ncbi:hypothetical protein ACFX2I_028183 [Malus domestica]